MILKYLKPGDEFRADMTYDKIDVYYLYLGNTKPLVHLKPFHCGDGECVHKVRELKRVDRKTGKKLGMGRGPWLTSESWLRDSGYTTKESEHGLDVGKED